MTRKPSFPACFECVCAIIRLHPRSCPVTIPLLDATLRWSLHAFPHPAPITWLPFQWQQFGKFGGNTLPVLHPSFRFLYRARPGNWRNSTSSFVPRISALLTLDRLLDYLGRFERPCFTLGLLGLLGLADVLPAGDYSLAARRSSFEVGAQSIPQPLPVRRGRRRSRQ